MTNPNLADDRLEGAAEIAEFYYGDRSKRSQRKVYGWLEKKGPTPPIGHEGATLIGSKSRLRAFWDRQTGGTGEP